MLWYFRIPVGWGEVLRRTAREIYADNCLGLAAQLAFYFFLALFPALLFLVSLVGFLPVENVMDEILRALGRFAPQDVLLIVRDQVREIARGESGGLLTFAILGTIWSSSAAMNAIIDTLNRAYDIVDSRPFWKTRLLAIGLTIGLALFVILSFALLLTGPSLAQRLAAAAGLGGWWVAPWFAWVWGILQWPAVFLLAVTGFAIVYYVAPDAEQEWVWITPGAVAGTALWLTASIGFRIYIETFGNYNETYGTIGGFIVLMLWFYLSGLALLAGAELNAEVEHLSPYGKDPGERRPGERKKIGLAAAREYEARRGHGPAPAPEWDRGSNCGVEPARPAGRPDRPARPSDWLLGLLVLAPVVAVKAGRLYRRYATWPDPRTRVEASRPSPSRLAPLARLARAARSRGTRR